MSEKSNFWTQVISTMNAVVKFGSISPDKQSIETLRVVGNDARHHFIMNETNKGSILNSPGKTTIKTGSDLEREERALSIRAENGDILIDAAKGRLKIQAKEIEFVSTSDKPEEGNIRFKSTNDFEVKKCRDFIVNSGRNTTISAVSLLGLKGNKQIHIITSLFKGVAAVTLNDRGLTPEKAKLGDL